MSFGEDVLSLVKQSGNPVLGKAPSWERVSLGEVATILNGYPWKSEHFSKSGGVPLIRIRDVTTGQTDTRYTGAVVDGFWVEEGDLLVGMDGDFNIRRWRSARGLLNQRVCKIRVDQEAYEEALLDFVLPGYLGLINRMTSSVTVKHLSSKTLAEIPLPLPPAAEQRRIAAKLYALTGRLARARAELDRVSALTNRLLDAAYAQAFTSQNAVQLEQLTPEDAPIIYGILQPGPNFPGGTPYVRPTEIDHGVIKLAEVRRTSPDIARQYRRATIREGDLILTIVGTIGKVAVVPSALDGGNITQSSCRIRPNGMQVHAAYLRHWLLSPSARKQFEAHRLGTAVPRLNIRDIRSFTVPLPSFEEQRQIAVTLDAAEARCQRTRKEAARARALLDRLERAILARAFRGELVPQDPNDEPAAALLARIRARRAAEPKPKRGRRTRQAVDA